MTEISDNAVWTPYPLVCDECGWQWTAELRQGQPSEGMRLLHEPDPYKWPTRHHFLVIP